MQSQDIFAPKLAGLAVIPVVYPHLSVALQSELVTYGIAYS